MDLILTTKTMNYTYSLEQKKILLTDIPIYEDKDSKEEVFFLSDLLKADEKVKNEVI